MFLPLHSLAERRKYPRRAKSRALRRWSGTPSNARRSNVSFLGKLRNRFDFLLPARPHPACGARETEIGGGKHHVKMHLHAGDLCNLGDG